MGILTTCAIVIVIYVLNAMLALEEHLCEGECKRCEQYLFVEGYEKMCFAGDSGLRFRGQALSKRMREVNRN